MKKNLFHLFVLFFIASQLEAQETTFKTNGPDDYRSGLHAFVNATIFKDYQTKLEHATLIIENGKVIEVSQSNKTPSGAIVHDFTGRWVYPSFIDLFSDYGMPEVKKVSHDEGVQYESNMKGAFGWNQAIKTDFNAAENFVVNNEKAEEWRKQGFGALLTHRRDGIARGSGAFVLLGNEKENKLILQPQASANYSFNKGSSTQEYPNSLMGSIALLRQTFYDADWYKKNEKELFKNGLEFNLTLKAWNDQQNLPQIFDAGNWENMMRAAKIAKELNTTYILKGNGSEYKRLTEIKSLNMPVIVPLSFPKTYDVEDPYKALWVSVEEMKNWELAPANLTFLYKEKIPFAITTFGLEKKEEFLKRLRTALQYGIPESEIIRALTFTPASLIGMQTKVGSLDKGMTANFIVSSQNIFDEKSMLLENWINGKKYEINKPKPRDIKGDYTVNSSSFLPMKIIRIQGESPDLKVKILLEDTISVDAKMTYADNDITLSFNPEAKKSGNKYLLTGTVYHEQKRMKGKGQSPDGQWFEWSATFFKPATNDTTKPAKRDTIKMETLGKIVYPFQAYGYEVMPTAENILFKNATIWTNEQQGNLKNADIVIKKGKIEAVGQNLSCNDCKIIDAANKHITSGMIDEHSHIAIAGGVNEATEASSAEVRIGDVLTSEDINIYRQLSGGVTASQLLHGSANPIGGQSALVKLRWGSMPEKMKIEDADGFIKFALGENVKQSNWGEKFTIRYPQTRMGVEQTYFNYFTKAKEYKASSKNKQSMRRDLELDALAEVLDSKRFITCHSYVQSEINMLMKVADTFGFKVNTFTHILEGYKVADKMKNHGANASTFSDWWAYKYEVIDAIPHNAGILTNMGICTAINSDDAEMARRLNQEAAKSIKYTGMSEENAWKMVTLNPAKMLHLDHRMGSLKAGKDADIVIWNDNPLSIYASVEKTFVDGICYYDKVLDEMKRADILKERARLIQKMLDDKKGGSPTQEPVKKENKTYSCGENHAD